MFYTILDNRIIEMPMEEITPDQPCIAYLDIEQLKEQAGDFNADELITGVDLTDLFRFSTGFDVYDDVCLGICPLSKSLVIYISVRLVLYL